MRALVFRSAGDVIVDEVADPVVVDPGDAVVRVHRAGLCGSDLHPYLGREPAAGGVVPGHEAVGEIVEVGAAVGSHAVGDRVIVPFTTSCGSCGACRSGLSARCEVGALFGWGDPSDPGRVLHGCQAELVRVPLAESTLVRCPEVEDDHAVLLADNLPTALVALDRAHRDGGTLAVVGLGSVGLCVVAIAASQGRGPVVAHDPIEARAEAARRLGAETGGEDELELVGAEAVVEAAGSPAAQRTALAMARPGATISIISVQTAPRFDISPVEAYDANLTLALGRAPVRSVLGARLDDLAAVAESAGSVVVDRPGLPLGAGPEAYRRFAERDLLKATFDPRLDG